MSRGRAGLARAVAGAAGLLGLLAAAPVAAEERPAPEAAMTRAVDAAQEALAGGEWELGESRLRTALQEGWLLSGALAVAEGRLEEARQAFERARTAAAGVQRAEVALALVASRRGEIDAATVLLRRAIARRPDDPRLRRLLAQVLILGDRRAEAVQELEEGLQQAPGDPETVFALAVGLVLLGELDEAEERFAELLRLRPGAPTRVLIGRSYRDARQFGRARAWLGKALEDDPRAVRAHFYLGMIDLMELGYDGIPAALDQFETELELRPEDPSTRLYYGLVLAERHRCEEAVPSLERAARWPPTALDAHRFLGRCLLLTHRPGDAAGELRAALALAGESTRPRQLEMIHYQLGVAYRALGDPRAGEHFEEARRLSKLLVSDERSGLAAFLADRGDDLRDAVVPPDIEGSDALAAWTESRRADLRGRLRLALSRTSSNLGALLARADQPARAAVLYREAATLDPDLPGVQRALGVSLFQAGRPAEAIAPLEAAVARDEADREILRTLALARLRAGRPAAALELLAADPDRDADPRLQAAYALALARSGDSAKAAAAFEELLARHPDWPELHVWLGQARARDGDFPGAEASLDRALELQPDVAEAHATLGDIHLRKGELDAAVAEFRAELEHHSDDVDTRYRLAVALDLHRQTEAAIAELEQVLAARPENADARYLMGKLSLAEGRPRDAAAQLETAAGLAPDDPNIRYQWALALQRLGEKERAAEQFEAYRERKAKERGGG